MAKYHFNIYPISPDEFSHALDLLKDFFYDFDPRFPYRYADMVSNRELRLVLKSLPENCSYLVYRSIDGLKISNSIWIIPFTCSGSVIDHLFKHNAIETDLCSRDVGYYDFSDTLNDLPYNYHYIIQRYYD